MKEKEESYFNEKVKILMEKPCPIGKQHIDEFVDILIEQLPNILNSELKKAKKTINDTKNILTLEHCDIESARDRFIKQFEIRQSLSPSPQLNNKNHV